MTTELSLDPTLSPAPAPVPATNDTETLLDSFASLCAVFAVALFGMAFVSQNFVIPSASMVRTLLIGDHVLVDRITLAPATPWARFLPYRPVRHGDVVVFLKPGEPGLFLVKRAIGLPGDRIHLRRGIVYRNGVALDEPQAARPASDGDPDHAPDPFRDNFPATPPRPDEEITPEWRAELPTRILNGDLLVPPGHLFVLGDNRTDSLDSRYWGFVPQQNIVGRPLLVYWSFNAPDTTPDNNPDDPETTPTLRARATSLTQTILHFFDRTRWERTLHVVR